jgi:phosphoglycolate phosphatase
MSTARPPVQAVIFDLDGTLVQTRIASWEVFNRVNEQFGLGVDTQEKFFDLFRGNVFESIEKLCHDAAHAAEVKKVFLDLLREDYTPPMVPGMTDVVRKLAGKYTLAVMSSNAMSVLRRVLVGNDLAFCFGHVFGGDVAPDKRSAIATFLADAGSGFGRRCSADYDEAGPQPELSPSGTVLVTDTAGDVKDALDAGIRVIGVSWGMHTVAELTNAGAEFVALWPQEVAAHLLGSAAAAPLSGACATGGCAAPEGDGPPAEGCCGGRATCSCQGSCGSRHNGRSETPGEQIQDAGARRRARRLAGRQAQLTGGSVLLGDNGTTDDADDRFAARVHAEVLAAVRRTCARP